MGSHENPAGQSSSAAQGAEQNASSGPASPPGCTQSARARQSSFDAHGLQRAPPPPASPAREPVEGLAVGGGGGGDGGSCVGPDGGGTYQHSYQHWSAQTGWHPKKSQT